MRYRRMALAFLPILGSCSLATFTRCADGSGITRQALILKFADKVAKQSSYSKDPNMLKYTSGTDLVARNPSCCFIYIRNELVTADPIALPTSSQITVMITYLKYRDGPKRYYVYSADMEPCPEQFDFSGYRESDESHDRLIANSRNMTD